MPIVTKRTSGNITISGTTLIADVGLDLDWDLTKSILVFNLSTPSNTTYPSAMLTGQLIEGTGYKSIRFERYSAVSSLNLSVDYQVIQLNTATVQRGSTVFSSGDTTKNITIGSVDLTKSFVLITLRTSSNYSDSGRYCIRANISTETNLRLVRGISGGTSTIVEWQVVTITDISSLQQKSGSFTNQGTVNVTVTSVDLTRTIVIGSYYQNTYLDICHWRCFHLTSSTNLAIDFDYAQQSAGTVYYHIYVIEFASGAAIVQSNLATILTTNLSKTITLSSCDPTKSLALLSMMYNYMGTGPTAVSNSGYHLVRVSSFTSTSLVVTRGSTAGGWVVDFFYQVITFPQLLTANKTEIHLNNLRRR